MLLQHEFGAAFQQLPKIVVLVVELHAFGRTAAGRSAVRSLWLVMLAAGRHGVFQRTMRLQAES